MSCVAWYTGSMQIDQLFEFVYVLIARKQVTAKEMAKHFGVSSRTVYRWVDALAVSGVPVYALKGRGGGIAISGQYALDKTVLSEEERLAIVSSVKALNSLSGNSGTGANARAAEKIAALAVTDSDWLEVDFAPWSPEGSTVRELFATLRDGILRKRQLVFDYYTGDGKTERRTVHPWKLVYRGQAWYLHGWCTARRAERFFKLTRMRNVLLTGRPVTVTRQNAAGSAVQAAPKPSMQSALKPVPQESGGSRYDSPPLITIRAHVAASRISYLLDSFICSGLTPRRDGSVTATFTVPDADWVCEMLLGFGPALEIVSPKAVREKVLALARALLKKYK